MLIKALLTLSFFTVGDLIRLLPAVRAAVRDTFNDDQASVFQVLDEYFHNVPAEEATLQVPFLPTDKWRTCDLKALRLLMFT